MGDSRANVASVLVVSSGEEIPPDLQELESERDRVSVVPTASVSDALETCKSDSSVGCVVMTSYPAEAQTVARRLNDVRPDVPVVVATGDTDIAPAVTRHGNVRFLGEGATADERITCVEDALQTWERRRGLSNDATMLQSMLDHLRHAIWAQDVDGHRWRVSPTPNGLGPDDVMGLGSPTDSNWYASLRRNANHERRILQENEPIHDQEERIETGSGSQWFRTAKLPWKDENDDVRGLVGMSWDVTDEMLLREQLQAHEESFDEFARSISHDVRTPLQVARGNLELARQTNDTDPLDDAEQALDRIEEMINDLQTVARNRQTLSLEEDAVGDSTESIPRTPLRDVSRHLWSIVETGDATLEFALDDAVVTADESSVRPVLENLFTNAIDHGGEDVTVRLGRIDAGGFYVADDGPGIPADDRDTVLRDGYTTTDGGSGTGLSIVSRIATQNGWDLRVTDSEDGGARFEFRNCLLVEADRPAVEPTERLQLTESEDVGDVNCPGDVSYDGENNRWLVEGAGANIWRDENEFHYLHTTVDGPVRITAKVTDVDQRSQYSKAGLMLRGSLAEDAAYGYVGVTPKHGTEVLWRTESGTDGVSQQLGEVPLSLPWYRLTYLDGEAITAVSPDCEEWHAIDQRTVAVDGAGTIGLAVCSHVAGTLCQATFESVRVEALDRE